MIRIPKNKMKYLKEKMKNNEKENGKLKNKTRELKSLLEKHDK